MSCRVQCAKCPWRKATDPRSIPDGYCEAMHRGLVRTIADGANVEQQLDEEDGTLRLMACHESPAGRELVCVGWLHHQLCEGNNVLLRLAVVTGRLSADYRLIGEQWETFEETLSKGVDQ